MSKRREDAPAPGAPAWMATFSDLMNLLLCFFVMLFSMSTVDEAKYNEMVAAMNDTFSIFNAGATSIGDGILNSNGVSQLNELDEYINSMGKSEESSDSDNLQEHEDAAEKLQELVEEQNLKNNEELSEMIQEAIEESNMAEQIEVSFTSQYVQLTMKGALLFDSGSAELKEDSVLVVDKVGVILERYAQGIIEIEGHTDNVPINSYRFADNEELSSARALTVFHYLQDHTAINPANLKHAGMGQRVPIADNTTPEGRSKNRRVEVKIYNYK